MPLPKYTDWPDNRISCYPASLSFSFSVPALTSSTDRELMYSNIELHSSFIRQHDRKKVRDRSQIVLPVRHYIG